ncbi:hypothetical protein [Actinokineospora pegani]|uniref:hypothetical protein n=1 Tax=Actinokineospora pegani TaxID=2654637 RepID=UPI0012EA5CBD|nr:hypothetical protein [Actinokineospora pegani]
MTAPALAARARKLLDRLGQVMEGEADVHVRTSVESAAGRARSSREALSAIDAALPRLREHGIAPEGLPAELIRSATNARTALRTAATNVASDDPRNAARRVGTDTVDRALESAEKVVRSLNDSLAKSAERWRLGVLPQGVNQPVTSYPGVSDALVISLRRIQTKLTARFDGSRGAAAFPDWVDEILELAARWERDRPVLEKALQDHHPEVVAFLRQAATEAGASWDLITPSVQKWLADPGHTTGLKVVLRS